MSSNIRLPYEWGFVVMWAMFLFISGLANPQSPPSARFAAGIFLAVVGGLIVATVKYYKRSPKPDSQTALATAEANDKGIFYGTLVLAAVSIGMAVYLKTYGGLVDAVILVGLGLGVKNDLGFARWLMAAYAFITSIILAAVGGGQTLFLGLLFLAACRSIKAHGYADMARDMGNKLISSSAGNTTSQQPNFSDSIKATPISSSQRAVQNAPAVAKLADTVRTPPIDAKPAMNNPPPVNATPAIAIESSQQSMQAIEDRLYEQIAQEIETNAVDKAIWTKVYAQAGGDEKLTRVAYIKARFEKLMAAENVRLEALQQEREEIARREQEQRKEFGRIEKLHQREKLRELSESDEVKNLEVDEDAYYFIDRSGFGDLHFLTKLIRDNPLFLLVRNSTGGTGLHMAVQKQRTNVAKFLAEEGALVDVLNGDGKSPIDIAKESGQTELTAFLQQFSMGTAESEALKKLAASAEGGDFLNWCCWGHIGKVKYAVEKNPLLLAITTSGGNTALHWAVTAKQQEIVKLLAGKGASVSARNGAGKSTIDIAKESGQADLAAFLQQFSVA